LVIACACAVGPLAAKVCLPPQSTLAPAAYASVAWELLHDGTARAAAASKLTVAADRLCFTVMPPGEGAPGVGGELDVGYTCTGVELTGKQTGDERVRRGWPERVSLRGEPAFG
jgi:hypothetical protein